jgi:hypothetical protein
MLAGNGLGAEPTLPEVTIPSCTTPPRIDGRLDDSAWAQAATIASFHVVGTDKATDQHKAWVMRDNEWLYVAFDVSQLASDREPAKVVKHDDNVQREDNVQVSFDPGRTGSSTTSSSSARSTRAPISA